MAIGRFLAATVLAWSVLFGAPYDSRAADGLNLDGLKDYFRRHVLGERSSSRTNAGTAEQAMAKTSPVPRTTVPLPRPRPRGLVSGRTPAASPATPEKPAAPVVATRSGRVQVRIDELGKERDSFSAVYLAPKERGRWGRDTVREARRRCEIVLAATNVDAEPLSSIGGPKGCGIAAPVKVHALGAVKLSPAGQFNCTMTAALYKWVTDVVQPAARSRFKQPVVEIREFASYSCRRRGGVMKGPVRISEHAFGNAIDVAEFRLADGTRISVLKDWGGLSALFNRKAAFLREVHKKACGIFSTVLGPEANKAHRNHFHFDLGRGGRYKYCH